jgi:hypothetical protein
MLFPCVPLTSGPCISTTCTSQLSTGGSTVMRVPVSSRSCLMVPPPLPISPPIRDAGNRMRKTTSPPAGSPSAARERRGRGSGSEGTPGSRRGATRGAGAGASRGGRPAGGGGGGGKERPLLVRLGRARWGRSRGGFARSRSEMFRRALRATESSPVT